MKNILLCLLFACTTQFAFSQTDFKLEPNQSMLMTGKGPGQDGTINPYAGQDCMAVVQNLGKMDFSIRIQKNGEILKTITVAKGETKKVKLLKDQELYLDGNDNGNAKARVDYEKIEP